MAEDKFQNEKIRLTPERGFNLVGIDYFGDLDNQLYLIEHFEMYQDALDAKKGRRNSEDFFILYKDASGNCISR